MTFSELFDETLDINSTGSYRLSVQAGYNGFSYCILDLSRNKYIMLRVWTPDENIRFNHEQLKEIIEKDEFLSKQYSGISIVIPSAEFTLVPAPMYDPGRKDEYFAFNHGDPDGNVILSNRLVENNSFLLFAVPGHLSEVIRSHFPSAFPFHHICPLAGHMTHAMKTGSGSYIHLHVESDFFNLAVYTSHALQYLNAFSYRNASDIVYYVLNVFKTLGIKGEETIHLSGLTERYDDLSSALSLYVRHLEFAVPAGNFTFSYVFNDTPLHRYINLFSLLNCA